MQERRRHGGIDATGKRQDDPLPAHLALYLRHGFIDEGGGRPIAAQAADIIEKVAQYRRPLGRVRHLGMELKADHALCVSHGGNRRIGRRGQHLKARRQRRNVVAVTHPHVLVGRDVGKDTG